MMNNIRYAAILLFAFVLASCTKEKSFETGEANPVYLGNDCRISTIASLDTATGFGIASHTTFFNPAQVATGTFIFDSTSNTALFNAGFTYRGDTMLVGDGRYFVRNATTGRVTKFIGPQDPEDPQSDTLEVLFSYNPEGNLIKKDYFIKGVPVPVFRSTYTYTAGNLTQSKFEIVLPGFESKLSEADLEYNTAQTVRNFLYVLPDGSLTAPYIMALNLGTPSKNVLTKMTTRYYDNNVLDETLTTTYRNYKFSRDGYVLELIADGDYQEGTGILFGKTKFSYSCK